MPVVVGVLAGFSFEVFCLLAGLFCVSMDMLRGWTGGKKKQMWRGKQNVNGGKQGHLPWVVCDKKNEGHPPWLTWDRGGEM